MISDDPVDIALIWLFGGYSVGTITPLPTATALNSALAGNGLGIISGRIVNCPTPETIDKPDAEPVA